MAYRRLQDGGPAPRATAGEARNISASGLCFCAPDALEADTMVALELSLEGEVDPIVALGRVIWCDREGAAFRIGVCFSWVREQDRGAIERIAAYVQTRLGS